MPANSTRSQTMYYVGQWPQTAEELRKLPTDKGCYPFQQFPAPRGKSQEWCQAQLNAAAKEAEKTRHA